MHPQPCIRPANTAALRYLHNTAVFEFLDLSSHHHNDAHQASAIFARHKLRIEVCPPLYTQDACKLTPSTWTLASLQLPCSLGTIRLFNASGHQHHRSTSTPDKEHYKSRPCSLLEQHPAIAYAHEQTSEPTQAATYQTTLAHVKSCTFSNMTTTSDEKQCVDTHSPLPSVFSSTLTALLTSNAKLVHPYEERSRQADSSSLSGDVPNRDEETSNALKIALLACLLTAVLQCRAMPRIGCNAQCGEGEQ
jgi:hypothetical protein